MTISPTDSSLAACLTKLQTKSQNPAVLATFDAMYRRYLSGDDGHIPWEKVSPLFPEDQHTIHQLTPAHRELGIAQAGLVGILKLNGGLGTTMGCTGAKSAIPIMGNDTFLDIIAAQVLTLREQYNAKFPLILMNSFYTTEDTHRVLEGKLDFIELFQHEFPRIVRETGLPFENSDAPLQEWAPPGHGDVLLSLITSGTAQTLLDQGTQYLLISNADNLGPTFSPEILGYLLDNHIDFLVETTPKTALDVKGGTVIRKDGQLTLLERTQVEAAHIPQFEDVSTFKVFNTNNIWLNLEALMQKATNQSLILPLIVNPKKVQDVEIIQLESAVGSAVSLFERSALLVVDRDRFLPVKKTSDLLRVLNKLSGTPELILEPPMHHMDGFRACFQDLPRLEALQYLKLSGHIQFGPGVVLRGRVSIENHADTPEIFSHCVIENQDLTYP